VVHTCSWIALVSDMVVDEGVYTTKATIFLATRFTIDIYSMESCKCSLLTTIEIPKLLTLPRPCLSLPQFTTLSPPSFYTLFLQK
jgi:hypothetical protein